MTNLPHIWHELQVASYHYFKDTSEHWKGLEKARLRPFLLPTPYPKTGFTTVKKKQPEYRINLRWYRLIYWPFLLPVALLLALFNKVSPIPFKIYSIRVERVGQMASNQEEHLCELDLGMRPKEFRVYIHRDYPSNGVLLDLLKRAMPIHQSFLPLFDVCHKLGGLGVSSMELAKMRGGDKKHLIDKTPQHLDFTQAELHEAEQQCLKLGIDLNAPFVPVLVRDPTYLKHIKEETDLTSYRNCDIAKYIPALESLADRYKVIRLGSVVQKELETDHPNILDYSFSGARTELLDVYLSAKCKFFVSTGTGLDTITSRCFRLPVVYSDFIPVSQVYQIKARSIVILKKYWHTKEERYLTLSELVAMDDSDGKLSRPKHLNKLSIAVHDCTTEEITDAIEEMEARLNGTWVETDGDKIRQEKFWSIYQASNKDCVCKGLVGSVYLRNNPFWLE